MPTTTVDIEKLSALYDRIYDIANRLIKKYSPCNIRTKIPSAKDLRITICNCKFCGDDSLCCYGCKYWNNGCTVKALGCKLFLCRAVSRAVKNRVLQKRFKKLRSYGEKHLNFDHCINGSLGPKWHHITVSEYYQSKEDWLNLLKQI